MHSDDSPVKSVSRVFAILELFDASKSALTATHVSKALNYPASSTIALLKSMTRLGYLSFDQGDFTYLPTIRLPMLSEWVRGTVFTDVDLMHLMERISEATGESVTLCGESNGQMQVLALLPSADLAQFSDLKVGDYAPLFRSAVGLTALSLRSDREIIALVEEIANRPRKEREVIDLTVSLRRIREIRGTGFGKAYGLFIPNLAMLAWSLPARSRRYPLVIGVGGPIARVRAAEGSIVATVRSLLTAHFKQTRTAP